LEEVARSSASVAHLYRDINLGEAPGQFRVDTESFNRDFGPILLSTGAIHRLNPSAPLVSQASVHIH
jgi:hypothetical protein